MPRKKKGLVMWHPYKQYAHYREHPYKQYPHYKRGQNGQKKKGPSHVTSLQEKSSS